LTFLFPHSQGESTSALHTDAETVVGSAVAARYGCDVAALTDFKATMGEISIARASVAGNMA
jgi:hypothetical protein